MILRIWNWDVDVQWLGWKYRDGYGRRIARQKFYNPSTRGFAYVITPFGLAIVKAGDEL